ncbi:hypothetical protein SteCoe_18763 [Stentor coeruleus]|uniref:EF-hand domain-containing protein n=1 Tax=Stentor coeruleus TaxID=5963 RepID=A0A1R2BVR0_9CILI|nr:hypothetical protein SteCoe_18763 [Stentor coeruleus]
MSFPQMYPVYRKLNQKSPISAANKEEESSKEDEYVFEKVNIQEKNLRPVSAKASELYKSKRPITSKHLPINLRRERTKKLVDYSILTRLKPRRVNIDKERLYEENMALKLKNNNLHEDITRLRTKINQIEKELNKREDQNEHTQHIKPAHLINSLKSTIKDLKSEINSKNDEIIKLKRNIRSTKINEIELEVQAYIDECTRLRHHLEEIMKQRETPQANQVIEDKTTQNSFIVNNLKKENEDLSAALKIGNDEVNKWKERVNELEKLKKKSLVKKNELIGAKNEILKLKGQIDSGNKEFGNKENLYKDEIGKLKKSNQELQGKVGGYEMKIKELMGIVEEQGRKMKVLEEYLSKNEDETKKAEFDRRERIREEEEKAELRMREEEERIRAEIKKKEEENRKKVEEDNKREEENRRKEEENRKKEEEAKKKEEEARKKEEAKKKEEEARKKEEAKKKEEEARKKEEENRKKEEEDRRKEEENRKKEEERRRKEEEDRRKEEEDRKKEEERRKKEEENRKKEEENRKKEEEKKKKEEEAKKKEEEAKKIEETKKKEESKRKHEEKPKQEQNPKEELPKTKTPDEKVKPLEQNPSNPSTLKEEETKEKSKNKAKSKKSKDKTPPKRDPLNPETKNLLEHFSFRMQINRIPKSKIFPTLFSTISPEKPITKSELSSYLKKPPFSYSQSEIETLSSFLLESKSTGKTIEEKLIKNTEDWEIFSPEDEEKFDENLNQIMLSSKDSLFSACQNQDTDNSGIISINSFKKALKNSSIDLPAKLFKYMTLLFYSHDMKINQVPYKHFIKAYGDPEGQDDDEVTDEEKAKVVRHYLKIISQILIQNKKGVMDVFECDESGIISPEEFYEGLRRIGMGDMEQDHVLLMLEALQFEEASEVCVHIEELEEILMHYGVNETKEGDEEGDEEDIDEEKGHYKKVSLLDSENYELSDDSPDKVMKKASSKGLSENSPFGKNKSFEEKGSSEEIEEYGSDYDDDFQ